MVDEVAMAGIDHPLFVQRAANAPDHAAQHLRVGGLLVEDAAGGEHPEHAP